MNDLLNILLEQEKPNPEDIFKSASKEEIFDRLPDMVKSAYREFGGEIKILVSHTSYLSLSLNKVSPGVKKFIRWGKSQGLDRPDPSGDNSVIILQKAYHDVMVVYHVRENSIYFHISLV